ncbi:nitrogen fixation protein FixJ [Mariprofundus ferrooxydans]|uniref:Response regulator FixJ n=2 Tax=Mariprofundus ferrooxydans TaxID=314344 RepID=Q0F1W4_9PROT|nr:response regulator FixJ [Mariprofundus ferrooxydans PV-1]KON47936.1 nitrogen fixation protein FixJ [Mariprofundus ferrooxydans]
MMFHVVDDSEMLREMLVDMIEIYDCNVMTFASASEYLEYVRSDAFKAPSAVLTDVHMPQMSGYEMMEQVLAIDPSIRFAILSGEPDIPARYQDKVCLFLGKPYTGDQIQNMIYIFKQCELNSASPATGEHRLCDRSMFNLPSSCSCPKDACN